MWVTVRNASSKDTPLSISTYISACPSARMMSDHRPILRDANPMFLVSVTLPFTPTDPVMLASHTGSTVCVISLTPLVPSSRLAVFDDLTSSALSESVYMLVEG